MRRPGPVVDCCATVQKYEEEEERKKERKKERKRQ